jgi:hypothetical protein
MKLGYALLLLSAFGTLSMDGASYYVSTTGSDTTGTGTAASPFRTIQRAYGLTAAGDTVWVANGVYDTRSWNGTTDVTNYSQGIHLSEVNGFAAPVHLDHSGSAGSPIVIRAINPTGAILDGGMAYGFTGAGDGSAGNPACNCADTAFDFGSNVSYISIVGFEIRNYFWNGAMVNVGTNQYIVFSQNNFHHIGNRIYKANATVTNASWSSGTATFTADSTSGLYTGTISLSGMNPSGYDFSGATITVIDGTHFSVPIATNPGIFVSGATTTGAISQGIAGVFAGISSNEISFDYNTFSQIGRLPQSSFDYDDYTHDHGLYLYGSNYNIASNLFYGNAAGWNVSLAPGVYYALLQYNTFMGGANTQQNGCMLLWATSDPYTGPNTGLGPHEYIEIQDNTFLNCAGYEVETYEDYEYGSYIYHNTFVYYSGTPGVIDSYNPYMGSSVVTTPNSTNPNP